ncbi:MAG: Undecaprenyl-phosphate galactose phosphotransferase, partial [Candidatus Acidoferrum typicum]|nr:Undecaprenyl-phosphate galactose phosphotransferase [Candidatus Acidoferrum typicum]
MSSLEMEMRRAENSRQLDAKAHVSLPDFGNTQVRMLLPENSFVSMLYLERRRAERARRRFVLVLVDVRKALSSDHKDRTLGALNHAISQSTRETDIIGWYVENDVIGLIGTELGEADNQLIEKTFLDKIRKMCRAVLGTERAASIS